MTRFPRAITPQQWLHVARALRGASPLEPERAQFHTWTGASINLDLRGGLTFTVRPVDLFLLSQGATRYNGAPPVTVLQHSALVLAMGDAVGLSPRLREVFALHDLAGEPYAGEVVTGLKTYTHRLREDLAEGRVREVLGVAKPTADEKAVCKTFDLLALSAEMTVWEHAGLSVWCPEPATPMARDLARRWTQEASDKECWELLVSAVPALAIEGWEEAWASCPREA